MEDRMKVMIAYDGSAYADAALDDLLYAGLPRRAEALIVSVGDGLVSTSSPIAEVVGTVLTARRVTSAIAVAREQAARLLLEARGFAAQARRRVLSYFPDWEVRTRVLEGSPSRELLREAERWEPDLIMVGSHGRSALGRLFLGSVSKALATKAHCSVRVGRRVDEKDDGAPLRIIVGVDGSPGAAQAVRAVGMRAWPAGTGVRLIVVDDGSRSTEKAESARVLLLGEGLNASVEVREGDPRHVLIDEARAWAADSIFVGSHGLDDPDEGSGLGSVSAALVTNAACSVEVVRKRGKAADDLLYLLEPLRH